ncbi:50S ribosomal protein L18P [Acidilobus saccharovorans 345-15]|uniref:Large ribosomal subunit protein uL18 n=1 Tax=Acidilobus saccharovorans (strain DSM 16705 / JCM 18335 / VKM B-2471 / 345-15) TaxID=666510 RepID=D9Q2U0_ACIS3|nr:50S ribosomal protein L18 [Acidilobus saccharovorans]ADL19628.1 50S ribosomal protein L18P [Acidilobus saccharovorans 345-15]
MKGGPNYRVPLRRRREGKTDYYKRFALLSSRKPRMVVRISNKYIWVQFIQFDLKGDRVIAAAHSRELTKLYGWKGSGKSECAAYLTGFLAAARALEKGVKEAVLDIGLHRPTLGGRVFAALKGALDAGVHVPHSDEVLPSEERIRCEHVASYAAELSKNDPEKYKRLFSAQLTRLPPEEIPKNFDEVLENIKKAYKTVLEAAGGAEQAVMEK